MTLIQQLNFHGLSITSPYKISITQYLHEKPQTPINTVVLIDQKYIGYNTDGIGCLEALKHQSIDCLGILGLGGTGTAIAKAAKQHKIKTLLCNRSPEKAKNLAKELHTRWVRWQDMNQLINCDILLVCLPKQVPSPNITQHHRHCYTVNYKTNDPVGCFGKQFFYAQAKLQNQLWINHSNRTNTPS